ncbi:LytTR family transcriptional regulator DNA-binding domain-containing protein [Pedobacter cryoconitis]|uniref:LytTR family transcriptional regulator DNA-binding domain-containing protein n=1 Tax=Pedobacter cryoconitis TaxID=188932 RepID=UPI000DB94109|nr:LytTR family transcriptional regulator DNA-binding domain-containing protein [Pedobacter cryoconitis]
MSRIFREIVAFLSIKVFLAEFIRLGCCSPQPPFYRVHKSYTVAIDKIRMIDGNTIYIQYQTISVGETYEDEFFKMIREQK